MTQAQFSVWTSDEGVDHSNHFSNRPDHPAENLNWHEATTFCEWLTKHHANRFPSGMSLARLPIEAEWEYACRGDSPNPAFHDATEFTDGDGTAALQSAGWFTENSGDSTQPVRTRSCNRFGLYDMHGNVWEWCADQWDPLAYRSRWDGITAAETLQLMTVGGTQNTDRVLRGGSWRNTAIWCRSACRYGCPADARDRYFGLRVCLVHSPGPNEGKPTAEPESEDV